MAALCILSAAAMFARYQSRRDARLAPGDSTWRLRYVIDFEATEESAGLTVSLPYDTPHCRVYRQTLIHPGLASSIARTARTQDQIATIVAPQLGLFEIVAEVDLHIRGQATVAATNETLSTNDRAHYLRSEREVSTNHPAVTELLRKWKLEKLSPAQLLERIYAYCAQQMVTIDGGASDAAEALADGEASALGRARAMVALCRAAKLPARLVAGADLTSLDASRLDEMTDLPPRYWVEVHDGGAWTPFDLDGGFAGELPATMVPIRRDSPAIVRPTENATARFRLTAGPVPPPRGLTGATERNALAVFDLTRLPLATQRTLALLLILPLGALVTALLRSVVGVITFGTFTPALLALSFVYAAWQTGVVILIAVLIIGLIGRVLLDRLKLLMVPRLGVVVTLVVLAMALGVSAMEYYSLTPGPQAVLLPIVILTMLIERAYITSEEDGVRFTVKRSLSTAAVALVCYLLLRWDALGRFIVTYPEAHLISAAIMVSLGRYTGYRLTELWRFHDLAVGTKAKDATGGPA